jgi:hypothetical protein
VLARTTPLELVGAGEAGAAARVEDESVNTVHPPPPVPLSRLASRRATVV